MAALRRAALERVNRYSLRPELRTRQVWRPRACLQRVSRWLTRYYSTMRIQTGLFRCPQDGWKTLIVIKAQSSLM